MPPELPEQPTNATLDLAAERIAVALLQQTATALLTRDAALFARAFALPHRLSTFERSRLIEDAADLEQTFLRVCDEFDRLGVTDLSRDCIAARFRDPDTIAHTYISHVLSGNRRVKDPYPCFSILTRQDGIWRVQSSDYALSDDTAHARALTAPVPRPGPPVGPVHGAEHPP